MDWNFEVYFFILCVSQSVLAFNIEANPWRYFTQNQDTAFGYKVIQKDQSSVIVSDPLLQNQDKRGNVYLCRTNSKDCSPLKINVPPEAVNMSLGLSMTKDPASSKILVCGPTIPKACEVTTTYNGMCFTIEERNTVTGPIPSTLRECPPPAQTDIAFLLDGSGSVHPMDFSKMKSFVKKLIQGLQTQNIKFAVAEFSDYCKIPITFNNFRDISDVDNIEQQRQWTNTANAINKLVNELFTSSAGARPNANRVLLVITDGESTDGVNLLSAIENAEKKKITRYAIGVGGAFHSQSAQQELRIIASQPQDEYIFKVDNFDLLDKIHRTLKEQIIAIEGTQTSGDSSRMEFAQEGFNAAFKTNGNIIMSVVGAFQWKGGYQEYNSHEENISFHTGSDHDSYLGYSMAVGRMWHDTYVILGAPRHAHKGRVTMSSLNTMTQLLLDPPEAQIGAYYGAEVCVVDLNADSYMDLLLVSAPLYMEEDQEGKIFVYSFSQQSQLQEQSTQTLEGMMGQKGRFGSALSSPGDLNGDHFVDVVVGAPLEDDGQGSIYIFNGRTADINPTYSQRIRGSSFHPGLWFFGLSLSEFALDHSGDGLPDIAVGSKGAVTLLRSRPIVSLVTKVIYSPSKIPTKDTDCEKPLENILRLCFTMKDKHTYPGLSANIKYILKLDGKRENYRAFFSVKNPTVSDSMTVTLEEMCKEHNFFIEACNDDALNPLSNQLTFTFEGLPVGTVEGLRPILHPGIKTTSDHNLDFEMNCGDDKICTDNLKIDFNFSGSSDIKVGIMQDMNVTVFVENRGENSYNSLITLSYPFGLSFRRFTTKQSRVECISLDSDDKGSLGTSTCHISKPIFRENGLVIFDITYNINKDVNFDKTMMFTATASSGNDKHSENSELFKNRTIGVKYGIYISLIRYEESSIHINFTAGKNNLEKPVSQILKVQNDLRDLTLTILIKVPIKLRDKDIWTTKDLQIQDCIVDKDEQPTVPDFVAALKNHHKVNCSVAVCRLFRCNANLMRRESKFYNISGHVSSGWIEQTRLRSAVFELVSTATLEYDKNKYVYFSSDSLHTAPTGLINTKVEVYEEKNILKEIIGGAVAGLLILALITSGLYKAGFFKSRYKQMLEDAGSGADGTE
ncbi:integrin alpha-M-like [Electrophorus electricus]|uniref:integrin alpha-M-like n=1 Tax=Electrophorus electricus TaxID=8005 RepID=UPI0015D006D8|nr:integrin alpha-M-like [Electrophorus electricus]